MNAGNGLLEASHASPAMQTTMHAGLTSFTRTTWQISPKTPMACQARAWRMAAGTDSSW